MREGPQKGDLAFMEFDLFLQRYGVLLQAQCSFYLYEYRPNYSAKYMNLEIP